MTPAKPQHMSGQNDDPDDLIAELTKLMATETRPGGAASATPKADPARAGAPVSPTAAPSTVRIPGVSQPVAAAPQPSGGKFDFGRPVQANATTPELHANWQDRLGGKPTVSPEPGAGASSERHEPSLDGAASRPAIAPGETESSAAPSGSAFEFDFGFNRQRPEAPKPMPTPAAVPPRTAGVAAPAVLRPGHDPIADLIAAELEASMPKHPAPAAMSEETTVEAEPRTPVPQPGRAVATPAPVPNFTPSALPRQAAPPAAPAPVQAPTAQLVPTRTPVPPAPAAPRAAPRPAPENDRFATAPVFGLGNRPSGDVSPPRVELDPMDEIESLIGEAVRVELNTPSPPLARAREESAPPRPAPAQPVVPPLGNQFAPRRTSLREPEASAAAADEAILAAAAATGSEVGRVDTSYADDHQVRQPRPKKQARRERPIRAERRPGGAFRQFVVPAIAGTILVALGFGLYWALGMSRHDGTVPVLAADARPAKTVPEKPADTTPHSVVMDELSGNSPAVGKETLAPRDQSLGNDAAQVAAATTAATENGESGLANRKVRTVTVRPDGTIVSSDDSVAGAAKLPVDRPNVPVVPGAAAAAADETLPAPATVASPPAAVAAVPDATVAPAAVAPVEPAAPAGATTADANAPVPLPPPPRNDLALSDSAAPDVASAQPSSPVNAVVRDPKPTSLLGNANGGADAAVPQAPITPVAHVQLSSQQSEAGAQASANTLQRKFGTLFNGAKLSIIKVDLGAKGIYYRVIMPTSSLADAQQLCGSIKSSGGDCVAANG